MSHNSFGHLFRFTSWGESHGEAIGCVVDGVPPRLPLIEADIQQWLDKRRPGQNRFTTQRQEADKVKILSGVFIDEDTKKQVTTGTPISLLIENTDQRPKDYSEIKDKYRPGHADYTYMAKYGIRDYRGGGRQSARETAMRVAAGAIARKVLATQNIEIIGALVQMGEHKIDRTKWDDTAITQNPFWCPDADMADKWAAYLDKVRKRGSSCGAVVEIIARHVPAGLGAPVYGKLDADLAHAMMSINAVKAVEIGEGFAAAALSGEMNADEMAANEMAANEKIKANEKTKSADQQTPHFTSNHAGGILGGISTGQDIIIRFAVKPSSSILIPRKTIDKAGADTEIRTKGRHDPCVGIRAVPVGEAMMALVLADHILRHRAQCG
ncbi:MAG: chorismate synthase [Alphaproteobacteria bacterium]|nr:chorismate synthase [Alphaproteobacteria bacterium]